MPLYINSLGASFGQFEISNSLVTQAGLHVDLSTYIQSRRTNLFNPQAGEITISEWFKKSSKDKLMAFPSATTEMGQLAVENALFNAEIAADKLGLVVGDSATVYEVTPSEGQRITGKLGLKIPCYDLTSGAGAFIVHIDSMRKWKLDKFPEYACCVSANSASHLIGDDNPISLNFSDAASAVILSMEHVGKFEVIDSGILLRSSLVNSVQIEKFGNLKINPALYSELVKKGTAESLEVLTGKYSSNFKNSYFVGSQMFFEETSQIAKQSGFDSSKCLSLGSNLGDSIGSNPAAIISQNINLMKKDDLIFVVQSGIGFTGGYVVLKTVR
jgi:3-oxoacyl-[acyl-carrier-protein] synthase III